MMSILEGGDLPDPVRVREAIELFGARTWPVVGGRQSRKAGAWRACVARKARDAEVDPGRFDEPRTPLAGATDV